MQPIVCTGLDRLVAGEIADLRGARVGLVANPTSVDRELRHAADLLATLPGFQLCALFGPEHGLRGDAQDMIAVDSGRDERTGLPVFSLYGAQESSLAPTAAMLDGLDVVVFDIQDVGSRYYTYVWTLVHVMRACAREHVRVVVLDRPNPIGGVLVEGGAVHDGYRSFVGHCSVPNRHGMTVGELARMTAQREPIDVELSIVELQGWRRDMAFADTGLPWVLPSPNMPTCDTALVYPGMCLIEGTEMSEGRGTTRPFELVGAPYVDGFALADALAAEDLPGVRFRPLGFTPMFHKHAHGACGGVQLHITDPVAFRPYVTGVALIRAVAGLWPDHFAWRTRAYEFVSDRPAIDLLTGSDAVRRGIDAGAALADLVATWADEQAAFEAARHAWLIYS